MMARELADGVRLAVTTLTVLPLPGGASTRVDRDRAVVAMSVAPAVGLGLGIIAAGVGVGAVAVGAGATVAAVLTVATAVALSRGLHLDGVADTADGLGSYADRDTALAIMRRPDIGPFGVAAVVLALLGQIAGAAEILARPWWSAGTGVAVAVATSRLAITWACRRGIPPARSEGLGALVAATVGPVALAVGTVVVAGLAVAAVPGRPWQGPLAVLASLLGAGGLVRHAVRRVGGVTGDVLGAAAEVAATIAYITLSI
jgi:adenosylcobinamide-GDP ribazoletransferase